MKRLKSIEAFNLRSPKKWKRSHFLVAVAAVYLLLISFRFRHFFLIDGSFNGLDRPQLNSVYHETRNRNVSSDEPPPKPVKDPVVVRARISYGRIASEVMRRRNRRSSWSGNLTVLEEMARDAWNLGAKAWEELENYHVNDSLNLVDVMDEKRMESCPSSVTVNGKKSINGKKFRLETEELVFLPCGLEAGSSITVIGTPENAHKEYLQELVRKGKGDGSVMVSQFMVELQGLQAVDGEDPPRILHFNPRLKGDWSKKPVIELNTCYRMQWGKPMRCDGLEYEGYDDAVDGFNKCEKWERSDTADLKESKTTSWLNRFIGRAKKPEMTWPFPFVEGKMFVLTLQAGMEGYHIYVGGRHIASFPYRPGFILEDATGLAIKGNVEVYSVYATSLPKSHPSFQNVLEMSEKWKSLPLPGRPVHLFIGILSATNHFAERMAIRKTWMQYSDIKSSFVVARFFVALSMDIIMNSMDHPLDSPHALLKGQRGNSLHQQVTNNTVCGYGCGSFKGAAWEISYNGKWEQTLCARCMHIADGRKGSRKEVNALLKKEAEYFGDIVILPFIDHYELVVLKTIAICEYGIRNITAAYIMKCDDDTFVRLNVILRGINNIAHKKTLYMGNLNVMHRPLRTGKWAVTYEEWPEEIYPPYANGPGYIISNDIASFIVSKHANQTLRVFKMEDVSMGMWVEEFNATTTVQYSHSWRFCQYGCMVNYFTAHYQSPRQMICLWDKLARGQAQCCNF